MKVLTLDIEDWFHILKTIYDAKFDGQGKGEIGAIRGSKNKIFHTLIKFIAISAATVHTANTTVHTNGAGLQNRLLKCMRCYNYI